MSAIWPWFLVAFGVALIIAALWRFATAAPFHAESMRVLERTGEVRVPLAGELYLTDDQGEEDAATAVWSADRQGRVYRQYVRRQPDPPIFHQLAPIVEEKDIKLKEV